MEICIQGSYLRLGDLGQAHITHSVPPVVEVKDIKGIDIAGLV